MDNEDIKDLNDLNNLKSINDPFNFVRRITVEVVLYLSNQTLWKIFSKGLMFYILSKANP